MRVERTGTIEPLTPRVVRFLTEALGGIALDDLQSPSDLRADYSCLNGLLAVEMKSLGEDASMRMDNLTDELRQRDDWPVFLGSAPMQSFLKNTDDPEGLSRRVLNRVGRGLINPLKKANRQLEAHTAAFPRRSVVRALFLVNEDHEIYDPHTVSYVLWHAVRRMEGGRPLYEHIDVIIYLTERHAQVFDGKVTFPIISIEGPSTRDEAWKSDVAEFVTRRWASWNNRSSVAADTNPSAFSTIDHIPESAPRHERWRTDYRRNPYLKPLSFEELRDRFDEIMVLNTLWGIKGSPMKIPMDASIANMQLFTHMMLEMGERGIPLTDFNHEPSRALAAARRLSLPEHIVAWLAELDDGRGNHNPLPG